MQTKPLTPRQTEIFNFIKQYINKYGYAPIYEEIGTAIGLSSTATIYNHIKSIAKKGYIKCQKGVTRGIKLIKTAPSSSEELLNIPILGFVSGTGPLEEIKQDNHKLRILKMNLSQVDYDALFSLQVKGNRLAKQGLFAGDYLILEYQEKVADNEIALVNIDNIATIRRLFSQNKVQEKLRIYGRVLLVLRFYSTSCQAVIACS